MYGKLNAKIFLKSCFIPEMTEKQENKIRKRCWHPRNANSFLTCSPKITLTLIMYFFSSKIEP